MRAASSARAYDNLIVAALMSTEKVRSPARDSPSEQVRKHPEIARLSRALFVDLLMRIVLADDDMRHRIPFPSNVKGSSVRANLDDHGGVDPTIHRRPVARG